MPVDDVSSKVSVSLPAGWTVMSGAGRLMGFDGCRSRALCDRSFAPCIPRRIDAVGELGTTLSSGDMDGFVSWSDELDEVASGNGSACVAR